MLVVDVDKGELLKGDVGEEGGVGGEAIHTVDDEGVASWSVMEKGRGRGDVGVFIVIVVLVTFFALLDDVVLLDPSLEKSMGGRCSEDSPFVYYRQLFFEEEEGGLSPPTIKATAFSLHRPCCFFLCFSFCLCAKAIASQTVSSTCFLCQHFPLAHWARYH